MKINDSTSFRVSDYFSEKFHKAPSLVSIVFQLNQRRETHAIW